MQQQKKSISIETQINPATNEAYGAKYAGVFEVRRPSISDKFNASCKEAARRNAFGYVPDGSISEGLGTIIYIICFVEAIACQPLPEWFRAELIFDEMDEAAVGSVWSEVQTFLQSFRPKTVVVPGGDGGAESAILVPGKV